MRGRSADGIAGPKLTGEQMAGQKAGSVWIFGKAGQKERIYHVSDYII